VGLSRKALHSASPLQQKFNKKDGDFLVILGRKRFLHGVRNPGAMGLREWREENRTAIGTLDVFLLAGRTATHRNLMRCPTREIPGEFYRRRDRKFISGE